MKVSLCPPLSDYAPPNMIVSSTRLSLLFLSTTYIILKYLLELITIASPKDCWRKKCPHSTNSRCFSQFFSLFTLYCLLMHSLWFVTRLVSCLPVTAKQTNKHTLHRHELIVPFNQEISVQM